MQNQTPSQKAKLYRATKIAEIGVDAWRAQEALKRKQRRMRAKQRTNEEKEEKEEKQDVLLSELIKLKSETTKETTVKTVLTRVRNLHKYIHGTEMDGLKWLNQTTKVKKFIMKSNRFKTNNTRLTYISSIMSVLKPYDKYKKTHAKYESEMNRLKAIINKKVSENRITPREASKINPWSEYENLYKSPKLDTREQALIGLYTLIPPRRLEYAKLRLEAGDTENSVNLTKKTITLINYKTAEKYGKQIISIPDELYAILKKYIDEAGLKPNDLLFPKPNGGTYNNFSAHLGDVFLKAHGKSTSVNLLRHSYVSNFLSKTRTIKEEDDLAYKMGNSRTEQKKYLRIDLGIDL